ncbi:hypothetical protein ABEB36_005902 [Hypothenemus hampei]|uniref:Protein shuttle craft n=1 Tax=Hypothenemus hampei TaxID=57062 RepID=A0ABD1F0H4_HYPHA
MLRQARLMPTAPEFYPSENTRGAVKKRSNYFSEESQGSSTGNRVRERNHNYFREEMDTQLSKKSSGSGVRKGYLDRKFKERNFLDSNYEGNNYGSKFERNTGYRHNSNNKFYNNGYYFKANHDGDRGTKKHYDSRPRDDFGADSYNGHEQRHRKAFYNERNSYKKSYSGQSKHKNQNDYYKRDFGNATEKTNEKSDVSNFTNSNKNIPTANQRERLTDMIDGNILECLVCCEKIKRIDKVWSCSQCYHIIHLKCIVAWAKSSETQGNWRCPACQNPYMDIPQQYICYCGKTVDPKADPNIIAHACDKMCLRKGKNCNHNCSMLCHPGPCPECIVMVSKPCGCGSTQQTQKCCSDIKLICESICNKPLNCGLHKCTKMCHVGECSSCTQFIIQECFCGKTGKKVLCDKDSVGQTTFCCENDCGKPLPCGQHYCKNKCHSGLCAPCETDINLIKHCYCGKTELTTTRLSCLDPIPSCNNICNKTLICGPPSKPHTCKEKCHKGKCPPCPLTTIVKCRCGHMDKEVVCQNLTTKADDARCEKKCTKKRLCGKHTCKQKCCIEIEHICALPCNKLLTCGLHRCELTCHSGRCPPCMHTSFEELYCACGANVLYPPVPCGTKPPVCNKLCRKPRPCGHPPNHECHSGSCPPCFVLTKQWCFGSHEQRAAIPCHQKSFSCGLPCGKPMPCGRHKCIKACHEGDCPSACVQLCTVSRLVCGHPCNKPCHDPPCPESSCKQIVPVTCLCGLQKSTKVCMDLADEYINLEMAQLKEKMGNLSTTQVVDLSDITQVKKPLVLKILECNDDCRIFERNQRLAIGLQIQNPDLSQKLTPRYSDYLKEWAKKDPKFCQRIHDKLTELVQLAKQSKQKSRAYSFESMNRDKRHFIHEYCEYFGMESAAYDAEPNRNVIATAIRDKSWLPSMSLLEVLQRENGHRKVPGPMLGYSSTQESKSVTLKLPSSAKNKV